MTLMNILGITSNEFIHSLCDAADAGKKYGSSMNIGGKMSFARNGPSPTIAS
jgi:hypothetical protein